MKKYYFKEKFFKITDHYPILDENGKKAFYVDQKLKFIGYKVRVSDENRKEILSIDREFKPFLPTYKVDFTDKNKASMKIKANLSIFRKSIDVIMDNDRINLSGNFFDYEFKIRYKGETIGEVTKKILSITDQYELTVYDENYTLELIILCLCLNNIKDMELESSRNNNN
ncbi:LURP-one-related/scramblase family protein [Anaerococcus prevotii]|uniref:Conserved domain protein n=1 Tax=Anaerococcus prevotii ACS-065-V-Col13 TaxID=879305 RepID=F0GX91_9FIRM|nr:LURP-one-related family protein [Anaerococcus prevotii]EGC81520.1 conserved domain protein [Anaerococcus prevotii ACS-065-V-Col13]MDU5149611.1 hypothetical protein [Anaerococcus prevotii]